MGKGIIGLALLCMVLGGSFAWAASDDPNVYEDGDYSATAGQLREKTSLEITDAILTVTSGTRELTDLTITSTFRNSGLISNANRLTFTGSSSLNGTINYAVNVQANGYMQFDSLSIGENAHVMVASGQNFTAGDLDVSGRSASLSLSGNSLLTTESFSLSGPGARVSLSGNAQFYSLDSASVAGGNLTLGGGDAYFGGGLTIDGTNASVTISNSDSNTYKSIILGEGEEVGLNSGLLSIVGNVDIYDYYSDPDTGADVFPGTGVLANRGGTMLISDGYLSVDNMQIGGGTTNIASDSQTIVRYNFNFNGGILDVYGYLAAWGNQPSMSGALNLRDGGEVYFGNSVTFTNNGITLYGRDNFLTIDDGSGSVGELTIGSSAYLDARSGSLELNGNLSIADFAFGRDSSQFNYAAGYDLTTGTVNAVTVNGELTLDPDARLIVSTDLLNYLANHPGNDVNIINAASVNPSSHYDSTVSTNLYQYRIYLDEDNGGLFAGDFGFYSDAEISKNLIKAWNPYTEPKNQAANLISNSFIHGLIDATKVRLSNKYAALSRDGQFNADTLLNLADPEGSGLRYDALMYYNGSNAASVSNATIALSGHIQEYLQERMNAMRRMKVLIGQYATPCGDDCGGSECSVPYCPGDGELVVGPPTNRIWAGLFNIRDNIDSYYGYAGYSLHGKGFMIGGEHDFGPLLSVGGTFAYTGGDFDDYAALADVSRMELYQFTAYGTYTDPTGVFISGTLGYAWSDNQLSSLRYLHPNPDGNTGWVGGDYRSGIFNASLQVGYDLFAGDYWTISPSLGVTHRTSWSNSHGEYFASAEASWNTLEVGRIRNSLTSVPLKVNAAYDVYEDDKSLLTLTGMLGYAYDIQPLEASGDINYAGLQGLVGPVEALVTPQRSRHAYQVGVGAKYNYNSWEFGLGYNAEFRKGWKNYTITGNVGVTF